MFLKVIGESDFEATVEKLPSLVRVPPCLGRADVVKGVADDVGAAKTFRQRNSLLPVTPHRVHLASEHLELRLVRICHRELRPWGYGLENLDGLFSVLVGGFPIAKYVAEPGEPSEAIAFFQFVSLPSTQLAGIAFGVERMLNR